MSYKKKAFRLERKNARSRIRNRCDLLLQIPDPGSGFRDFHFFLLALWRCAAVVSEFSAFVSRFDHNRLNNGVPMTPAPV